MEDKDYDLELKKLRRNAEIWLDKLLRAANGLGRARKKLRALNKKRENMKEELADKVGGAQV